MAISPQQVIQPPTLHIDWC